MPIDAAAYPVNLIVRDRSCLVVGGGRIAQRKISTLLECGALVTVIAPCVSRFLLDEPRVKVAERAFAPGDCAGHWFVVAATNDSLVNAAVAADAEAHGVWVNAADDPANCSATLPAVLRRGPVTIAVGTGGASPAVASFLRDIIDTAIGADVVAFVEVVASVREELRAAGIGTEGLPWQEAFDEELLADVASGDLERARERLRRCLSSS